MPSFKTHTILNTALYILALYILLTKHQSDEYIMQFSASMFFFTVILTPDADINTPLKHVLDHRGPKSLHFPLWWIGLMMLPEPVMLGGMFAVGGHLGADFLKRDVKKVMRS